MKNKLSWMKTSLAKVAAGAMTLMLGGLASWATTDPFTTAGSTTWTCPVGVTTATVECWGGGGSGGAGINGGSTTSGSGAGGGGGGGYSLKTVSVSAGTIYTVVVGSGGAAGTSSNPGTDSSFATPTSTTLALAKGGSAGVSVNGTLLAGGGGAGGQASAGIGDTKFSGGKGADGVAGSNPNGGGGGGSSAGTGVIGNDGSTSTGGAAPTGGGAGANGATSSNNGSSVAAGNLGGGGGGAKTASATQRNGGAGGTGKVTVTYTVSVSPSVTPSPSTLTGFTYSVGAGPSASQSFTLSVANLTAGGGNITISGSTDYEVSTDNSSFGASKTLAYTGTGSLAANTVYVRLVAGKSAGTYNSESIGISGGGATASVTVSGNVTTPTITPSPSTLSGFTYAQGAGPSASQSFTLTAANLTSASGNITISGSTDYEVSTDNSSFGASKTLAYTGNGSSFTSGNTVYVRLKSGLSQNTYNSEPISISGGGGLASVTASGSVTAPVPSITVSPSSLSFGAVLQNGSSDLSYSVSGGNLTADITVTAPANFQISTTSGSGFVNSLTLTQTGGSVASTTVYVRFSPTAQQSYPSVNITHTSTGANNPNVAVSGTGANLPAVTTQAASPITASGATFNGTVTANGGTAITDRGFYYKTSAGVTTSDTKVSEGGTTVAAYLKAVTGLNPNQVYFFRAYAVNAIGTTLDSSDTSFTTLANTPVAPTVGGATQNSLNVAIGSDGNPAATTYAIQETGSSKYVQGDGTLGVSAVYQTAATWGTKTVTGLSKTTSYTFQVKAQNGASVATSFGPTTSASTTAAPFTPGNIVVERVGDGVTALSSAANPVYLDEYTTAGTLVQSVAMPTTAGSGTTPNQLTDSGTATSDGMLTRSADGNYLLVPGYVANVGTASVASGSGINRCVGIVKSDSSMDTTTSFIDGFVANNLRCVVSADGNALYLVGNGGTGNKGLRYTTKGSTTTANIDSSGSMRCGTIFKGDLYYNVAATLYKQSGPTLPTTATTPATISFSGSVVPSSMYQLVFLTLPSGDVCYIADDAAGILKYSVSGSGPTLTYQGTITASGVRGLTGSVNGSTVTLFGTTGASAAPTSSTSGGSIYTVTDTAANNVAPSTTSASPLVALPNNVQKAFRGIAFAPKGTQTITPIATTATKTYGDSAYSVATTASSGLTVTYASDNTSVATVNASGSVTIVGAGTAHITASQLGNDFYLAATSVQQTLTVSQKPLTITATGPSKPYGTALSAGTSTANFTAGATGVGSETVTSVTLTPDAAGLSATTAAGSAYVVTPSLATGTGGFLAANYNITYNPYNGTVALATQTIAPIAATATKAVGNSAYSVATTSDSGLTVTYASDTPSVATVDASGSVTIVGIGTAVITASQAGNGNYTAATPVTQTLTVYSFTTDALSLTTSSNTAATVSYQKVATHVHSTLQTANVYPASPWTKSVTTDPTHGTAAFSGSGSLTYTPTNYTGGADSFTVTFGDGYGSQTMLVSVTVTTNGVGGQGANAVLVTTDGSGHSIVRFAGLPGTSYTVETNSASSGSGWVKEGTYMAPTNNISGYGVGVFQVSDPLPPSPGELFYRTVTPAY